MKRKTLKIISTVLVGTFIFQDLSLAQGGASLQDSKSLKDVQIPYSLAIPQEANATNSKNTIIHIQDAHDSLEAQKKITDILSVLSSDYDVKSVALEGSSGDIDPLLFKTYPDQEWAKKSAETLLAEGRLNAGEFFAITSEKPVAVYGVENRTLYRENLKVFKDLLKNKEKIAKDLKGLTRTFEILEERIYGDTVKLINRSGILSEDGKLSFTKKWDWLKTLASQKGIHFETYLNLKVLDEVTQMEHEIDFVKANDERQKLLSVLKATLDQSEMSQLLLKSLSFKAGKISDAEYHLFLSDMAHRYSVSPDEYSNLARYTEYVLLFNTVDLVKVLGELENFEDNIKQAYFVSEDERILNDLEKLSKILLAMASGTATAQEFDAYEKEKDKFGQKDFETELLALTKKYHVPLYEGLRLQDIFDALPTARRFYKLAEKRNKALIANTLKKMQAKGEHVAALVTGGFHTQGISNILKDERLSYLIILPKITDPNKKRPYITILTHKAQSYEEDFSKETSRFKIVFGTALDTQHAAGAQLRLLLEPLVRHLQEIGDVRQGVQSWMSRWRETVEDKRAHLNFTATEEQILKLAGLEKKGARLADTLKTGKLRSLSTDGSPIEDVLREDGGYLADAVTNTLLYIGKDARAYLQNHTHFAGELQIFNIRAQGNVSFSIEGDHGPEKAVLDKPGSIVIQEVPGQRREIKFGEIEGVDVVVHMQGPPPAGFKRYSEAGAFGEMKYAMREIKKEVGIQDQSEFDAYGIVSSPALMEYGIIILDSSQRKDPYNSKVPNIWKSTSILPGHKLVGSPFGGGSVIESPENSKDIDYTRVFHETLHQHPEKSPEGVKAGMRELYIVLEGAMGLVSEAGGKNYLSVLKPGDVFVTQPYIKHGIIKINGPYKHLVFQIPNTYQYGFLFKQGYHTIKDYWPAQASKISQLMNEDKEGIYPLAARLATDIAKTPATHLLKALGLDTFQVGQNAQGVSTKTIQAPKPTDKKFPPIGLEILRSELQDTDEFELLYNDNRLIAVFPKTSDVANYIDLSYYYLDVPRLNAPGVDLNLVKQRIMDFSTERLEQDAKVIEEYKKNRYADKKALVKRIESSQSPFALLEVDPQEGEFKGHWDATSLNFDNPEELSHALEKLNLKMNQVIIPVFPTVYSPAKTGSLHKFLDHGYYRAIYNEAGIHEKSECLIVGPGTGADAWVASLKTKQRLHAVGRNPIEVANLYATTEIAGFQVNAVVGDNIIDETGKGAFPGKKFDWVLWNMPQYAVGVGPIEQPIYTLAQLHDGDSEGKTLKLFAKGLKQYIFNQNVNARAIVWNVTHESTDPRDPNKINRDIVEVILRSAGDSDFSVQSRWPIQNYFTVEKDSFIYRISLAAARLALSKPQRDKRLADRKPFDFSNNYWLKKLLEKLGYYNKLLKFSMYGVKEEYRKPYTQLFWFSIITKVPTEVVKWPLVFWLASTGVPVFLTVIVALEFGGLVRTPVFLFFKWKYRNLPLGRAFLMNLFPQLGFVLGVPYQVLTQYSYGQFITLWKTNRKVEQSIHLSNFSKKKKSELHKLSFDIADLVLRFQAGSGAFQGREHLNIRSAKLNEQLILKKLERGAPILFIDTKEAYKIVLKLIRSLWSHALKSGGSEVYVFDAKLFLKNAAQGIKSEPQVVIRKLLTVDKSAARLAGSIIDYQSLNGKTIQDDKGREYQLRVVRIGPEIYLVADTPNREQFEALSKLPEGERGWHLYELISHPDEVRAAEKRIYAHQFDQGKTAAYLMFLDRQQSDLSDRKIYRRLVGANRSIVTVMVAETRPALQGQGIMKAMIKSLSAVIPAGQQVTLSMIKNKDSVDSLSTIFANNGFELVRKYRVLPEGQRARTTILIQVMLAEIGFALFGWWGLAAVSAAILFYWREIQYHLYTSVDFKKIHQKSGARLAEKPLKFQLDRFHKDEVMIPQLVTTFFWKPFDLTHPETSKSFNELILFFKSLIPKQPSQAGVIYSLLPNLPIAVAFHVENEVIAAVLTAYEEFGEDSIGALLNFFGIAMAGLFGPGSANKPIRVVHDDRMRGEVTPQDEEAVIYVEGTEQVSAAARLAGREDIGISGYQGVGHLATLNQIKSRIKRLVGPEYKSRSYQLSTVGIQNGKSIFKPRKFDDLDNVEDALQALILVRWEILRRKRELDSAARLAYEKPSIFIGVKTQAARIAVAEAVGKRAGNDIIVAMVEGSGNEELLRNLEAKAAKVGVSSTLFFDSEELNAPAKLELLKRINEADILLDSSFQLILSGERSINEFSAKEREAIADKLFYLLPEIRPVSFDASSVPQLEQMLLRFKLKIFHPSFGYTFDRLNAQRAGEPRAAVWTLSNILEDPFFFETLDDRDQKLKGKMVLDDHVVVGAEDSLEELLGERYERFKARFTDDRIHRTDSRAIHAIYQSISAQYKQENVLFIDREKGRILEQKTKEDALIKLLIVRGPYPLALDKVIVEILAASGRLEPLWMKRLGLEQDGNFFIFSPVMPIDYEKQFKRFYETKAELERMA